MIKYLYLFRMRKPVFCELNLCFLAFEPETLWLSEAYVMSICLNFEWNSLIRLRVI
jgi:hypothetical protein